MVSGQSVLVGLIAVAASAHLFLEAPQQTCSRRETRAGAELPDVSHTMFDPREELPASGLPEDHPAYREAVAFIRECERYRRWERAAPWLPILAKRWLP